MYLWVTGALLGKRTLSACPSCHPLTRPFPMSREEVESGLTFLGLLVMENRLKSETRPVLQELSQARIRSVMVTGESSFWARQLEAGEAPGSVAGETVYPASFAGS